MRIRHVTLIIFIAIVVTLAINVVFGNYLAARLSTLPIIRKFNLLNPRAPIVINNRETVRVSDANDAVEAANAVKSKLSSLVYYDGSRLVHAGVLLNWTADGYFVTSNKAFSTAGKTYAVLTNNGDVFPVTAVYPDTASNAVVVATDARGLSTVDTLDNKELRPGQKILFVANSFDPSKISFLESYVRMLASDVSNVELDSDRITRGVTVQSVQPLLPGEPAVSLDSKISGIWDGDRILGTDAIRNFTNNFFTNNKIITRAGFGFKYVMVTKAEAKALQLSSGAKVTAVVAAGPAGTAGLKEGDIIIAVKEQRLDDGLMLEEIFEGIKPGEATVFSILRAANPQTLVITPVRLK